MAIKKSELYSSLWAGCDELRGGMDASQYKDYVLVLLFIKYVSDKFAGDPYAAIEVPKGGSFADMIALKGSKEIGDGINKIIAKLAEANELKGVIDVADFNDSDKLGKGKEMVDRLSNLVAIFEDERLDFSKNRAEGDDILGDAYEYLMRHFATESGKSKGQFYTPAEVSRIMAKVIGVKYATSQDQTIYDPTCGSGSLLLKAADESDKGLTLYGQEKDNATAALAKMNMILHNHASAEIWKDNTLAAPHFLELDGTLKKFDFVVANPPFSDKKWTNGVDPRNDPFDRFRGFGTPPPKNGDYAFLLHVVRSLKSTGSGAIILPHGVLFRGNAEAEIRQNLIKRGYIKGIIGLPINLFYGTGIPACIIVLDKEGAENRKSVFIVDASNGYVKDGNKNRLRERDIHKVVDVFTKELEIPKFSRVVPLEEIEKNDYNLNIPRYIDSQEEEDLQDIEAHLLGGIPQSDVEGLQSYWKAFPSLKSTLFAQSNREGYYTAPIAQEEVRDSIFSHSEFSAYMKEVHRVFEEWKKRNDTVLKSMGKDSKPKEIIYHLAEDILNTFDSVDLVDKYTIYQYLMTYWNQVMQDDAYMIAFAGWKAEVRAIMNKNGKQTDWDCDLIPKHLVIQRFFKSEQVAIDEIESKMEELTQQMEEMAEEHSGEEGLLEEVKSDSGNISKTNINKRMKEIKGDDDFADELEVLQQYMGLLDAEADLKKRKKSLEKGLNEVLYKKYGELTEEEVKSLVVEDKWLGKIEGDVIQEVENLAQKLAQRVRELEERYEETLPSLEAKVSEMSGRVEHHLKTMGFSW